jgi:hypothetical protein
MYSGDRYCQLHRGAQRRNHGSSFVSVVRLPTPREDYAVVMVYLVRLPVLSKMDQHV